VKRASRLADRIIEDVMALGWPVGHVLGAEGELLERYSVSRAVFREAVRLLEQREVARTRRGPGGGLVVTEPTVEAVMDAVVLYLHRVDARLDEVFEAKITLEEIATELAVDRLEEEDLLRLRSVVDGSAATPGADPREFHAMLARMTRNPAIELFVDVVNRVAMLYSADWLDYGQEAGDDMARAHRRRERAAALLARSPSTPKSAYSRRLQHHPFRCWGPRRRRLSRAAQSLRFGRSAGGPALSQWALLRSAGL
jgi:DNA-binding FadR family transcriptional regulator